MSAIDFAKMQKQMRAEAAAGRVAAAAGTQRPEPGPEERHRQPERQAGTKNGEIGDLLVAAATVEPLAALPTRALDLEQHRCCSAPAAAPQEAGGATALPRDVFYIPNFVDEAAEAALAAAVAGQPGAWVQLRERRLQCHGGTVLPEGTVAEPIPPHLHRVCTALPGSGVFSDARPPNHVLVNEYAAGEGIMPHRDGPLYHPPVAILSLSGPTQGV